MWHRVALWSVLLLFALFFLTPMYVMLTTSLKDMAQIREGNLLSLPTSPGFDAWAKAWSTACTGVDCGGLKPFFMNSVLMVIPAVLRLQRDRRRQRLRAQQVALQGQRADLRADAVRHVHALPGGAAADVADPRLAAASRARSGGWCSCTCSPGLPSTTLFFRNYYVGLPDELIKAAMLDGAGFWRIFWRIVLPLSTPILVVTLIWQFTNIWNDFLFGVVFSGGESQAGDGGPEQPGQHLERGQGIQRRHGRGDDRRAADAAGLHPSQASISCAA